jgi:ATP-dependent exoDNAse (exonuclease V) beta subunit
MSNENITVTFDEPTHTYTDNLGRNYTSVTTLLKKYKPEFDRDKAVKATLKKRGLLNTEENYNSILKEWEVKTVEACERGTEIHKAIEFVFENKGDLIKMYNKDREQNITGILSKWESIKIARHYQEAFVYNWLKPLSEMAERNDVIFYPEKLLFSSKHLIAGTADMIVERDGEFSIMDWKTNKSIDMNSWCNPKTKEYKMMLGTCYEMQDCNYSHYSLQLNIYAYLLGKPINKLTIVHLTEEGIKYIPVKVNLELAKKILDEQIAT